MQGVRGTGAEPGVQSRAALLLVAEADIPRPFIGRPRPPRPIRDRAAGHAADLHSQI